MNLMALMALIGFLLIFGVAEIFFCNVLLGILPNFSVVLLISVINLLVVLFVIRLSTNLKTN